MVKLDSVDYSEASLGIITINSIAATEGEALEFMVEVNQELPNLQMGQLDGLFWIKTFDDSFVKDITSLQKLIKIHNESKEK